MSHTIIVTRMPDETSDDVEFTIGGEHGHDCEVLTPCKRARCRGLRRDYDYGDERTAHGVFHEFRDGEWLVTNKRLCGLNYAFGDDMTWNEQIERAGLGTHPVTVEWDGDWWLMIVATEPKP
jgi:hypothetical protein